MIGIGGTVSWIPRTGNVYIGPTVSLSTPGNSIGVNATLYTNIPRGVNATNILRGSGSSVTVQPFPLAGYTVTASPTGGAMGGWTVGTKTPGSYSAGYGCVPGQRCP
jgi:hypothetical protein